MNPAGLRGPQLVPRRAREGHDEAYLPAQQDPQEAKARIPRPDEDQRGPRRAEAEAGQGPQAPGGIHALQVVVLPGTGRLRRSDRLRDRRDFQRIQRSGRRVSCRAFVMLLGEPGPGARPGVARLGVTVSRKVGGAVVRNRVKRCVREWFRHGRDALGRAPSSASRSGVDVVVIARREAAGLRGREMAARLDELARRAGCLAPGRESGE